MPKNNKQIRSFSRFRNPMNHMTTFYKTEAIKFAGGYPNIYLREDYGLWAKLISLNKNFINIDDFLVCVNGGNNFIYVEVVLRMRLPKLSCNFIFSNIIYNLYIQHFY